MSKGAKISKVSFADKLRSYRKDHIRVAKDSFHRLIAKPLDSALTWAVIGIALALPVGFYVALGNVQTLSHKWEGSAQISLFLKLDISEQSQESLLKDLAVWPEIEAMHVISKDEGLEEFKSMSGYADVLNHLETNPLPVVVEILPTKAHSDSDAAQVLVKRLQKLPQVDLAQLDLEWVQRLAAMLAIGQSLALCLVVLLSAGVLLIIGNTIRLEIENRRDEIIVVKLVGGTDAFVRRPFLYTGFWYGLGGGVVASVIVWIALMILNEPVARLAGLYQSNFELLGLSLSDTVSLWIMASALGLAGAWLSVSKHLDALEPR